MKDLLRSLDIKDVNHGGFGGEWLGSGPDSQVITPVDGSRIATVKQVTEDEYDQIVDQAHKAFLEWRSVPAPVRGNLVRQLGNRLREKKKELGALVTLEMGKILAEGEGEVPVNSTVSPRSRNARTTACSSSGIRWVLWL
jgi:aldehyde dehydrogenase (NAD+)